VRKPPLNRGYDPVRIGADQFEISAGDRLGALGRPPVHQQRHSERGGLLLDSAGIAEDEITARHGRDIFRMGAGLAETDPGLPEQHGSNLAGHERVGMEDDFHLGEPLPGNPP
jgi:hypothetical protein